MRLRVIWANTLYNFVGTCWQVLLVLFSVPILVGSLGLDRYGLLNLLVACLNVILLLDFGIGAGVVRTVAALVARENTDRLARLLGTCLSIYTILGAIFSLALAASARALLEGVFQVPPILLKEATLALLVAATGLVVGFPRIAVMSIPVALQRMDISAGLTAVASAVNVLGTVALAWLGFGLVAIAAWQVFAIAGHLTLGLWAWRRYFPQVKCHLCLDLRLFASVARFGGFKFLSSLSGIIVFHVDRLIVGLFFSLEELGYYSVAVTIAQKLLLIVNHMAAALFPAVSTYHGRKEMEKAREAYVRYSKMAFLLTLPVAIGLFVFSKDALLFWMGPVLATSSEAALKALAIGFLMASVAGIPGAFAEGMGRPAIPACFAVASAALNLSLTVILIPYLGIAAPGWALTLGTLILLPFFLHTVNSRVALFSSRFFFKEVFRRPLQAGLLLLILFAGAKHWTQGTAQLTSLFLGGFVIYAALVYTNGSLSHVERAWLSSHFRGLIR